MEQARYLPVTVGHPSRVSLVFFTDVHLAAKPPGRRQATYMEEILGKLQWCSFLAHKLQGVGLCGGDLIHVKNPRSDSNPLGMITKAMAVLHSFPTGCVYGIVGNHDVTADNMASLPDQPLGLLMAAGAYCDVPVLFEAGDGTRVLLDTFHYENSPNLLQAVLDRSKALAEDLEGFEAHQLDWSERPWHYAVAMIHAFNKVGKTEMMYDRDLAVGHDDLADTVYNACLWGHDHARKGIITPASGTGPTHVQLGSLARAAWASDEIDRPVSAAILSFDREGMKVLEREVPVKPLELAFHTANIQVEKVEKREDVTEFLAELEGHAAAVDSDNPVEILRTLTDDAAIITTIMDACELSVSQPTPAP